MGSNLLNPTFFFIVSFSLLTEFASPAYISNAALSAHETIGRNLLQAKKECDEDFTHKNYTILTSNCKGPQYPRQGCCKALSEFGCPFADKLNNQSNNCAATMFSYINLYGKYPPGLFSNLCTVDKEGVICESEPSTSDVPFAQPALLLLTSAFLVSLAFNGLIGNVGIMLPFVSCL